MSPQIRLALPAIVALAAGIGAALFVQPLAATWVPSLAGLAGFIAASRWAMAMVGTAIFLVVLIALGFLVPAVADSLALGRLSARLQRLGLETTPEALLAAFRASPLIAAGQAIAASLWQGRTATGGLDPAWRAARDPGEILAPARRTRDAAGHAFGQASLALLMLGGVGFVWLSRSETAGGSSFGIEVAMTVTGAAILGFLGARLLTHLRLEQLGDIEAAVRTLFPLAASEFLVDRMMLMTADDQASRAAAVDHASRTIGDSLGRAIEDLKATLASHDRRIAASVAAAVQRVAQPITSSIEEMLARLEAENSARAAELLHKVLSEFVDQFQTRFAGQMQEIGGVLSNTSRLVDELRRSYETAAATQGAAATELGQSVLDAVRHAVEAASQRQTEAIHTVMGEATAAIALTNAAVERWSGESEVVANAIIQRNAEEMKRTAAAFNRLHTILETLSISLLPAVNRLVTTQERLHATLESSQNTAQSAASAARELGEAARIAREMVERQMVLTRELAQIGHGPVVPPSESEPTPDDVVAAEEDADFVRAIGDLHDEAADELRSLPRL